ncbi:hypothetical protein FWH09_01330 [Candidatus Saccharibacteria bacterium]|nr:hypothetical protein [Candidatus Saccharibacteria bacterium]
MKTNWSYKWAQIKAVFGVGVDLDVLVAYQHKFPRSIKVKIQKDGKWLTAIVESINGESIGTGFATQARTEDELIKMINDAVQTYMDLPPEVSIQMPLLLPEGYDVKNKKFVGRTLEFSRV